MEGSSQFNQEPVKITSALDPKQELPTFDIAAVNKMIQPSINNSVTPERVAPEATHHVLHPEQEELPITPGARPVFGKLEVAPGVDGPRDVKRPSDRKAKNALAKAGRTVAASLAVVAGVGGALGAGEAKADQVEDYLKAVATVAVINGVANSISNSIRQAQFAQSAPTFASGAIEQLQAMGIAYDPATRIFYNRSNPQDEPISFGPKTMTVRISPVAGGVVFSAMVSNGAGGSFLERLMVTAELVKVAGQPDRIVLRKSRI